MASAGMRLLSGPALVAISSILAIVFSTLVKWINIDNAMVTANTIIVYFLFIRGLMLYLGAGFMHVKTKQIPNPKTIFSNRDFQLGLLIGAVSFGIALSVLTAIMHITQSQTMSFLYAAPLLMVVVTAVFFKKSITFVHMFVVTLGMAGLLSIMDTGTVATYDVTVGYGCAFLATVLTALYIPLCKLQKNADRLMTLHTMGLSNILCAIAFTMIANDFGFATGYIHQMGDFFALLTIEQTAFFGMALIASMLSNVLGQIGFSSSGAIKATLGLYSGVFWTLLVDYFVFGNVLTLGTLTGMAIIATMGVFCIYYGYSRKARPSATQMEDDKPIGQPS